MIFNHTRAVVNFDYATSDYIQNMYEAKRHLPGALPLFR